MKLYLVDQSAAAVEALRASFLEFPEVTIQQGDLLELADDTLVSAANSLGLMDGGLDHDLLRFFGTDLQSRVQELICRLPEGRLPVGSALLLNTGHPRIARLIVAPTVDVPGPTTPASVYFAMSALLRLAHRHPASVRSLYCPCLGAGIGQVPPDAAASEMASAYRKSLDRAITADTPAP